MKVLEQEAEEPAPEPGSPLTAPRTLEKLGISDPEDSLEDASKLRPIVLEEAETRVQEARAEAEQGGGR